jgi:DNA-binding MarR family transcriptional regulator
LQTAAEKIGAAPPAGTGSFGQLRSLKRDGPRTGRQLARTREVSRQHIQILANGLAEQALFEFADNPAHKRSKLLKITELGEQRLARLTGRIEDAEDAYEEISPNIGAAEIRPAIKVLSEPGRRMASA